MTGLRHTTSRRISSGSFYPLGTLIGPEGVNFALFSQHAEEVYLLLFDRDAAEPSDVIRVENCTRNIWHVFVHGVKPGQEYGYKVCGAYDPARGLRFNSSKLLLDPYAKAVTRKPHNTDNLLLAYNPLSPDRDLDMDTRDNSSVMPRAIVIDDDFDWEGDRYPDIPIESLVIYEVHVKGFTAHQSSQVNNPGTYLGFIEKIPYLKKLGINAVELLPVHESYVDDVLFKSGLTNYWGYNTIGFFAPEISYSTRREPGCQVREFKAMVRELHRAGIEVILDVVYNHTCEGNENGPTISLKGIDNTSYYGLTGPPAEPKRFYRNYTGCGNSVDLANPAALRLVMDSLRYWAKKMRVDGFRFDLASVLGREKGNFTSTASFFDAISQDPVLNRVKLIAEPWDIGTYQVGNFPVDWSEWNGQFRDAFRKFGKGEGRIVNELGERICGSPDLYADDGRSAYNSVNFITCHDGFTLHDLVSYNDKHNESNLEKNRDGSNDNNSWNCGVEGESDDPEVVLLRKRLAKNFICYLLFSSGTPMLLGGDEFLRTQRGNNNAYCQDNELSWFDWNLTKKNADILEFTTKAIAFTRRCSVLQSRKFFVDASRAGKGSPLITWFGQNLGAPAWDDPELRTLSFRLDVSEAAASGDAASLFFIYNVDRNSRAVALPPLDDGMRWHRVIDTDLPSGEDFADEGREVLVDPPENYAACARSTVVLMARKV